MRPALHGHCTKGAELYLTASPCTICAKMIVNAGISKVVYMDNYPDQEALDILGKGGVEIENFVNRKNGCR